MKESCLDEGKCLWKTSDLEHLSCSKTGCLKRIFLQPNKSATKATRWYGCSGWYANLPSSARWERGFFNYLFCLPCCVLVCFSGNTHSPPHWSFVPGKVLLLLWCLETWRLVPFSILIEGRSWKRHCDQLGCWWWDWSLAPKMSQAVAVCMQLYWWHAMVFFESCIIFWGVLSQNLSFSRTVLVVLSGWGKNMRMMVGLSDAWQRYFTALLSTTQAS